MCTANVPNEVLCDVPTIPLLLLTHNKGKDDCVENGDNLDEQGGFVMEAVTLSFN